MTRLIRRKFVWLGLIVILVLIGAQVTGGLRPTAAFACVMVGGLVLLINGLVLRYCGFGIAVAMVYADLFLLLLGFMRTFDLQYDVMLRYLPDLMGFKLQNGFLQGAALTIFVCIVSIMAATLIAFLAALGRLSRQPIAYGVATFYVSFFRGTPLMLQVMLIFLGLPQIGLVLAAIPSGILALSLCYGAYMAEIFRAGIIAVPRGQTEGAMALGLSKTQALWLVVMPQAVRLVIPPTGSQFIAMLKDSALVSILGAWELLYIARAYGRAEFRNMEMLIAAAAIYWAMSIVMEYGQSRLEKNLQRGALKPM